MKMRLSVKACEQGGVLIFTLFTGLAIGIVLASLLVLAASRQKLNMRSMAWNAALPVLEAGIEEAFTHLRLNSGKPSQDGWERSTVGGETVYAKRKDLTDGSFYFVTIYNATAINPIIYSQGFVPSPLEKDKYICRMVRVDTATSSSIGLKIKTKIELDGNKITIDSFDSSDPLYSTDGLYVPSKRLDRCRVTVEEGIEDAMNIGNADIWGTIATTPTATVSIGPQGGVGNRTWHEAGKHGLQPGAWTKDATATMPDPPPPPAGAIPVPAPTKISGMKTITIGSGVWVASSMNVAYVVTGNATLICQGTIKAKSSQPITVKQGASLKLYAYDATDLAGSAVVNETRQAANFILYGMSDKDITFKGGADFIGQIWAPNSYVSAGGGSGGTPFHLAGSLQAKALKLNGGMDYHYDEALGNGGGLTMSRWKEL